jgi:hypothetical protein
MEDLTTDIVPTESQCTNCSVPLVGRICHTCGEEQPNEHDLSIKHFVHELADEMLHFDSKVPATLRNLVFNPGFLSVEYFAGRKTRYLRPLRMYLIIFAINFFLFSFFKPVALYDFSRIQQADTSGQINRLVEKIAIKSNTTPAMVIEKITVRWQKGISVLQIMNPMILAGVLMVFFGRNRIHFAEHLVFALHFQSFTFLLGCLMFPIYLFTGIDLNQKIWSITYLLWAVEACYLYLALMLFYQGARSETLLRTVFTLASSQIANIIVIVMAMAIALFSVIPK